MNSILLKVANADLTSPFQGFQFEIGKKYICPDFDPDPGNECSRGFYATDIEGVTYAHRPGSRVFEVKIGGRNVNADPIYKRRWEELTLIREVFRPELEALAKAYEPICGYRLSEAIFPINPLQLPKRSPTAADVNLLEQWRYRKSAAESVLDSAQGSVLDSIWNSVMDSVGDRVCDSVWGNAQWSFQYSMWNSVWNSVRDSVAAYIGSLFPNIDKWYYVDHEPGKYPFQPAADLWRKGLIPSFDGKIWRLHSGKKAEIVWEEK